jgi:acyl-CoA reductase-like NAD-dependent aldehyde dehydrogenase
MLEGRRDQFVAELKAMTGVSTAKANAEVDAAIDSWVWHAGWSDKIDAVAGNMNPVAGPFFNISTNQPTGVVAALAPQDSSLVGLVNTIAPAIVSGNTIVVVAASKLPLSAITLTEVLSTSDLPAGVVNVLTGLESEIGPWLASHQDVNAVDLEGASSPVELEIAAAETIKRVIRKGSYARTGSKGSFPHITDLMEVKTVWHPKGH